MVLWDCGSLGGNFQNIRVLNSNTIKVIDAFIYYNIFDLIFVILYFRWSVVTILYKSCLIDWGTCLLMQKTQVWLNR